MSHQPMSTSLINSIEICIKLLQTLKKTNKLLAHYHRKNKAYRKDLDLNQNVSYNQHAIKKEILLKSKKIRSKKVLIELSKKSFMDNGSILISQFKSIRKIKKEQDKLIKLVEMNEELRDVYQLQNRLVNIMLKLIKYSNDLMKKNNQIKNWDNGKLRSKVQIIQKGLVLERMKFNFMKENVLQNTFNQELEDLGKLYQEEDQQRQEKKYEKYYHQIKVLQTLQQGQYKFNTKNNEYQNQKEQRNKLEQKVAKEVKVEEKNDTDLYQDLSILFKDQQEENYSDLRNQQWQYYLQCYQSMCYQMFMSVFGEDMNIKQEE